MNAALIAVWRFFLGLERPSKTSNIRALRARDEAVEHIVIREATVADLSELARVHVTAWNATYAPMLIKGPTVEIRERQWREAFARREAGWFCFLAQQRNGRIAGFVTGNRADRAGAQGELNKIYLLREYQRLGLGRLMLCRAAKRFLEQGITSMSAYVDPRNPSGRFFESFGAEWLRENGRVNYTWYVWPDLRVLVERCVNGREQVTGSATATAG